MTTSFGLIPLQLVVYYEFTTNPYLLLTLIVLSLILPWSVGVKYAKASAHLQILISLHSNKTMSRVANL